LELGEEERQFVIHANLPNNLQYNDAELCLQHEAGSVQPNLVGSPTSNRGWKEIGMPLEMTTAETFNITTTLPR